MKKQKVLYIEKKKKGLRHQCEKRSYSVFPKMPRRMYSPIPIDLLNMVSSFVGGDDYHYLTFELTPKGFLSQHKIYMRSRTTRKKSNSFYTNNDILHVWYRNTIAVRERYPFETRRQAEDFGLGWNRSRDGLQSPGARQLCLAEGSGRDNAAVARPARSSV